jgi:predicted enzyme related to lactoylglutathione lyase
MSTQKDTETGTEKNTTPRLVWFEIPADNIDRAKTFYGELFGWKIANLPGMTDYLHIDTGGSEESLDGGMMARRTPGQTITNYVSVDSVNKYAGIVEKLGGNVCVPKTEVPQMGYFAICQDTENNVFGLWETIGDAR